MSEKIVQLNEEVIKGQIRELVRGSVEETLNGLLEAEAEKLTQAARYERSEERQGYRSGHYSRNLTTTSGDVTLNVPRLKGISFETAIIERYRMVTAMLRNRGIQVNHKRVERIWRDEGLKLPKKQIKKRRLWMNDGSCVRLRAEHKNHVWSYDFVEDRTTDGRKIRILNIIDEFTHECLASLPRRSWRNNDVIEALSGLMLLHGTPEYLRSDNGSEFTAKKIRAWLQNAGVITAYIEPGSPWENGYCESFNARMRDEYLNGELFGNMHEAKVLISNWVRYYNEVRPHSSLGGRPPAPQTVIPLSA